MLRRMNEAPPGAATGGAGTRAAAVLTSASRIRPLGPLPGISWGLSPNWRINRRARGEAVTRSVRRVGVEPMEPIGSIGFHGAERLRHRYHHAVFRQDLHQLAIGRRFHRHYR